MSGWLLTLLQQVSGNLSNEFTRNTQGAMMNFALTGLAGYVAPRHLKAIHDTGNRLIAAVDPHDSVGIIDRYFPGTSFFTDIERFDRHLEMLRHKNDERSVDYLSVCSPNHLHDAHVRLALRLGAHAICEKPLVLNPWNLDALQQLEQEYERCVFTVLQLRLHPQLQSLKVQLADGPGRERHQVLLTYVAPRGTWYRYSWKGQTEKSGGLATNIGIHLFDLLIWLFGSVKGSELHLKQDRRISGFLELERADVQWFLSVHGSDLPVQTNGKRTWRSLQLDGHEIEFSSGFEDLHTRIYEQVLVGAGFDIDDARPSIELVHQIRNQEPVKQFRGKPHPLTEHVMPV